MRAERCIVSKETFSLFLSRCNSKNMNNKELKFIHFKKTQIDNKEEKLTKKGKNIKNIALGRKNCKYEFLFSV
jgi:hypothetical protein